MSDLVVAGLWVILLAIPLALSVWALLDAAHRPEWVWALVGRRRPLWMGVILFGVLSVVPGLVIATTYLTRIRPVLARAEQGRL